MNEKVNGILKDKGEIDISNLHKCTEEVRSTLISSRLENPKNPTEYKNLLIRLEESKDSLPDIYINAVYNPFLAYLKEIGEQGFNSILNKDKELVGLGGLIMDIAQAILQRKEKYYERSTNAFQAVVSDLYEGVS